MHENGKYLTARIKGKEYKITDKVLRDIYEFKSQTGTCHNPAGFKVDSHWALLSPCEKYKKTVSMQQYLKNALFEIRLDTRHRPNLGNVVEDVAEYFGVQVDEPKIATHAAPSQAAAGTSTGPAPAASHDAVGDDIEADERPDHEDYQLPLAMDEHSTTFSLQAPVWFSKYQARNDEQLRSIHFAVMSHNVRLELYIEQNDAHWKTFVESNDEHWTEQNRRWDDFLRTTEEYWTAHDKRWDT
ncbi:potassium-transporting ATPase C chain [Striga asiatica]|uniref:Potassium-transporting ATPase C chain n=1 Tax=Striga asiatica TaxID=4170 RepID=A0A5A7QTK8_STRAF|nr:potassium-transporting ATPase C chain [Striga asiatica]